MISELSVKEEKMINEIGSNEHFKIKIYLLLCSERTR